MRSPATAARKPAAPIAMEHQAVTEPWREIRQFSELAIACGIFPAVADAGCGEQVQLGRTPEADTNGAGSGKAEGTTGSATAQSRSNETRADAAGPASLSTKVS